MQVHVVVHADVEATVGAKMAAEARALNAAAQDISEEDMEVVVDSMKATISVAAYEKFVQDEIDLLAQTSFEDSDEDGPPDLGPEPDSMSIAEKREVFLALYEGDAYLRLCTLCVLLLYKTQ